MVYYTILYYTILYYTILYYTILYYTILYCTILYYTVLYYTILYYTILYDTILYDTIQYYTMRGVLDSSGTWLPPGCRPASSADLSWHSDASGATTVNVAGEQKHMMYYLNCNLLRPLIKIPFLLVPYGYIIIKIKKNSSGDDSENRVGAMMSSLCRIPCSPGWLRGSPWSSAEVWKENYSTSGKDDRALWIGHRGMFRTPDKHGA